jgi:G3E family GTPase
MPQPKTRLVLVGGFLGAGKTTLLREAAIRLASRGHRVGLLANDQAANLVDTAVFEETGAAVDEVAGGCFCCRFNDMVDKIDALILRAEPDFIIAEPVGSCTDISATVLQPLKQLHGRQLELSLYSVLIDVKQVGVLLRLREQANPGGSGFPDEVLYIYRKQVEEADLIVLNKADLVSAAELDELRAALASRFPETPIVAISALTGVGVREWLELLGRAGTVGGKIADVDYDTYAAGEAALGWLNASATVTATNALDWSSFARQLLNHIQVCVQHAGGNIGHLKLHLASGEERVIGNITDNNEPAVVSGNLSSDTRRTTLLLNARAHIGDSRLQAIAEAVLKDVCVQHAVTADIQTIRSLSPSRPEPVHRFTEVVNCDCL